MPDAQRFDLIVELPDDGSRQKEVYARFGLVAYKAQVFDHALVNLVTVAVTNNDKLSANEIDHRLEDLFKKTSGALVSDIGRHLSFDAADLEACRTAVMERNRLIHGFFREHAENFMTASGQQVMLDDLGSISDLISSADEACQRTMMRIGEPFGLSADAVDRHLKSMMERIQSAADSQASKG